jgi:hypothetical protein
MYHHVGRCVHAEGLNMNAKMFTDDGKARILVHITFACNQFEKIAAVESESL